MLAIRARHAITPPGGVWAASPGELNFRVYVIDVPTTGLHFADNWRLFRILRALVDQGNRVIVIRHNLHVIKNSDWIGGLRPEGETREAGSCIGNRNSEEAIGDLSLFSPTDCEAAPGATV